MKIGYTRVSKQEQNEALQRDALKDAGCEKYFGDKMTGSKFERKGLEELLAFVRPGDTVVVWKLDRLGRSLKDLIETLNILKDRGVDFISVTENIDTTTTQYIACTRRVTPLIRVIVPLDPGYRLACYVTHRRCKISIVIVTSPPY